jgi:hypothetical protein
MMIDEGEDFVFLTTNNPKDDVVAFLNPLS